MREMTNDELINWAHLEGSPELRAELDALIWISKQEACAEVWKQIALQARMEADTRLLTSYPGGLLKRRKNDPKK